MFNLENVTKTVKQLQGCWPAYDDPACGPDGCQPDLCTPQDDTTSNCGPDYGDCNPD